MVAVHSVLRIVLRTLVIFPGQKGEHIHPSKERLMKDRTMVSTMCPICRCPAKRKIRWFSTNNSKVYYSLALCHEHGPVAGKIRIRKTDEGKYFGVKTLRAEDTEAADEIREKHESLRRRKMLRSQEKI